ncbi:undecaprenyldiphospho-muramoylpentapeptide beta-N-acetylglucosaminyltransferase [Anderseniella sp. Alg231-50]|uniref:undecaprenyldiphospho-muramoylpentapeptide beta-N-acetylglucosaminyltransferase n=1 Tax=Anderseniella sp. Alg231-50 TaxID=1922226 RepID=UPI000D55070E
MDKSEKAEAKAEAEVEASRTIVLASGGTGGHLFPAQALASALEARDWKVHLFTDKRGLEWQDRFRDGTVQEIASSTLTFGKPWLLPGQASQLVSGFRECLEQFKLLTPQVVVGFGGYPSLPVMMAARYAGISSMVHEQNAVAGRANRIAAGLGNAKVIASSFEPLYGFSTGQMERVRLTGNPVRKQVIDAARSYEVPRADAPFNLLVFGGSQGAQFFSDFMPKMVAELPKAVLKTLRVAQQCRPEDIERVRQAYEAAGVTALCKSFFDDMPELIARSHLVMCRAGASSVAELGVIGRPAIYVPLPHSLDNDQLRNAQSMEKAGGGWVMLQNEMMPQETAAVFTRLRFDEADLTRTALAASAHGRPNAAELLADQVEELARETQSEDTAPE